MGLGLRCNIQACSSSNCVLLTFIACAQGGTAASLQYAYQLLRRVSTPDPRLGFAAGEGVSNQEEGPVANHEPPPHANKNDSTEVLAIAPISLQNRAPYENKVPQVRQPASTSDPEVSPT